MLRLLMHAGLACSIGFAPLPLLAQLPGPADQWWVGLGTGGTLPSATFEIETGATMTVEMAIRAIDGSRITMATTMSVMGNTAPERTKVVNAESLDPNAPDAALSEIGVAPPTGPGAGFTRVEDTKCEIGELELDCSVYELRSGSGTMRIWHSPAIPPVFMNGMIRTEITRMGVTQRTVMTGYRGRLLDP